MSWLKLINFFFPIDFMVMDIEEDDDVPLILGKTFMQTARMMIDLDDGLMKVRVENEEVNFNLNEAMKHSKAKRAYFKMDATEEVIMDTMKQLHKPTPLERVLTDALNVISVEEEKEIEECLKELETLKEILPHEAKIEELKEESKESKVEEQKIELKVFPSHLNYVFLEDDGAKSVNISISVILYA